MEESKRLAKNTFIIAVGSVSTKLITFLLLPFYTSCLSAGEYGTYDYVVNLSVCLIPFITLLMDESMFRFLIDCETEEERKKVITSASFIQVIGMAAFLLLGSGLGCFTAYPYINYMILYTFSCSLCSVINPILRGQGNYVGYTLYNAFISLILTILNLVFILVFDWGLQGLFAANIIAHILVSLIAAVRMKIWRFFDVRYIRVKNIKKMIFYSLPLIPNKLSWSVIMLSDRVVLMNALGSPAVGLYAVACKFPTIISTIYGFFGISWQESAARVLKKENFENFYNDTYRQVKSLLWAVCLGTCACMPLLFRILIDSKFQSAFAYVPALVFSTYFGSLAGFFGGILSAYKNTKVMGYTTVLASVINVLVDIALVGYIGLYAGVLSSLAANYFMYRYRKWKIKRYVSLKTDKSYEMAALVCMLLVLYCYYGEGMRIKITGILISVVFAVLSGIRIVKRRR